MHEFFGDQCLDLAGRRLQAGLGAEREMQLPPEDTRVLDKNQATEDNDVARGRLLRRTRGRRD